MNNFYFSFSIYSHSHKYFRKDKPEDQEFKKSLPKI